MELPEPIRGKQFRSFNIPLESVQNLCRDVDLPIPISIHRLKRGEVNAVFKLQNSDDVALILKVWVRQPNPTDMLIEKDVVHRVLEESNVPTPRWIHTGWGDENIRYPYAIMEHIEGEDADVSWIKMSLTNKKSLIEECALTLRALHGVSSHDIEFGDVPSMGIEWAKSDTAQFQMAVQKIYDQGWMSKTLLRQCEEFYKNTRQVLEEATDFSIVHYDFQLHNMRVNPKTNQLKAVLDFGNTTLSPAITDARDLNLGVFLHQPELGDYFWSAYGVQDNTCKEIVRLHSLTRVLSIMAAYWGPTPSGWNVETIKKLLE